MSATCASPEVRRTSGPEQTSRRLLALDVFRGLCVAGMILVDNPGDDLRAYAPIQHTVWNGWTPADLIFPSFVFMVGVSLVLSYSARRARGETRQSLFRHALKRSAILMLLGIVLNGFPVWDLSTLRYEGVLQRIAVCYFVAAILVLWGNWRSQIAALLACLVGYWALLRFVPIPGVGVPGRDLPFLDPDNNIVAWLDRWLFMGHLYNVTRDPEGILSTIPAIGTALIGVGCGRLLNSAGSLLRKIGMMLPLGAAGIVSGLVLNRWFPINKNLWTSSFVLFSAGVALIVLAVLLWVTEIRRWRAWTIPAVVFGTNAIAGFVADALIYGPAYAFHVHRADGSLMLWQEYANTQLGIFHLSPANTSLLYSLLAVTFGWSLVYLLYRKRIFLKV